ncbi:hypothetical protein AWM68_03900 [Fictibacillus phosphorivorans]|uniref:Uncharacterized protein n=1 Tax=Fictibacillus phosphorivorans TaxID=1221500 RepID=A0A163SMI9_9BACL|nr:hypothetical protein [Fictibacillus phosphorivorans]KZE69419.1 hypothetical protein AWM68_03900 [Fictibacillus phosphorivorans]
MQITIFVMTAVETPGEATMNKLIERDLPHYEFSKRGLFTSFSLETGEHMFKDENDTWYVCSSSEKKTLHEIKYGRQIFPPPYAEIPSEQLSFVEMLERYDLKPLNPHYDKGLCHVIAEVEDLDSVPLEFQSRLAHADGDDDPQVAHAVHYIESKLNGKRSRFISGWESHSFATITESREFAEDILFPVSSWLYLLYFQYFLQQNGTIPSQQMMPRLLGNLWASTMKDIPFNKELLQIEKL